MPDLIEQLNERRAAQVVALRAIPAAAEERGDANLSETEQSEYETIRSTIDSLDSRIADLTTEEARDASAAAAAAQHADASGAGARSDVQVGREALTYREGGAHSFLQDAFRAEQRGDAGAQERLGRHSREMDDVYREYRDVGTGAFSGLVIPQYLIDEFQPFARAGRPFLDICRNVPLPPDGLTVNISKLTTGTGVAAQATEGTAVQETNADDTLLTVDVRTYAGMQDVSRQAIERGTMVEDVIVEDLLSAYYTTVDAAAISGAGTSGTHKGVLAASGINAVTYTDASPTAAELWPKIADGSQQVAGGAFRGATHAVMHPRRFGFFMAAVDSAGRPLVVPIANGPMNSYGQGAGPMGYGATGYTLQGLDVVTDGNVPINLGGGTNEDRIIIVSGRELIYWEDPAAPLQLRLEQPLGDSLQIRFVVYGYSAFTAERQPKATSVISGTGLVTPTF